MADICNRGRFAAHRRQARLPHVQRMPQGWRYSRGSRLAGDEAGTDHRAWDRCLLCVESCRSWMAAPDPVLPL